MEANNCEAGYFCDLGSEEATPRINGSFVFCREGHFCEDGSSVEGLELKISKLV